MLKNFMSQESLADLFRKQAFHSRFPPAADRDAWMAGDKPFRKKCFPFYVQQAEALLRRDYAEVFPPLKAEDFFAYVRNGDRRVFETAYFTRRSHLALFCLAEAIEYKKRFLPGVIEGLWQLLSEPVWYVSAHAYYHEGDPMPRLDLPRTDLFCADTGALLACVVQLLGKELEAESRELFHWLREFCIERVILPIEEERVHEWWLDGTNNWGPWCSSNVAMTAFTFLYDQPERLARLILKLAETCGKFYDRYAPDGGCDEGAGYYMVAGIRLMIFLDQVNAYTNNGCAALYSEEKFRNIGDYIAKVHLTGPWFASMADSPSRFDRMNAGLLNRFAELSGSPLLRAFAVEAAYGFAPRGVQEIPEGFLSAGTFLRLVLQDELARIFWFPENLTRGDSSAERITVLPNLQYCRFRQHPENDRNGTVLCIKGGHNDENHNHNDVGQFELFCDGEPVVIDCGQTDYTRLTFSDRRYENRFLNSSGHDVPIFNDVLQAPGAEFAARDWRLSDEVSVEIAGAYPAECGVTSCVRRAVLAPDGVALIEDTISGNGRISVEIPLYSAVKPEWTPKGFRIGRMRLKLSNLAMEHLEEIPLEDVRMKLSWGGTLWCIHLKAELDGAGTCRMEFLPLH